MHFDMSSIMELVFTLLSTVLTYYGSKHLKSKSVQHTVSIVKELALHATNAAEQMSKNKVMSSDDKKEFAVNFVTNALNDLGINLSDNMVESFIESAVSLFNKNKPSKLSTMIKKQQKNSQHTT